MELFMIELSLESTVGQCCMFLQLIILINLVSPNNRRWSYFCTFCIIYLFNIKCRFVPL